MKHHEQSVFVAATPQAVFAYVDDHARFSSHMNESSWMMGGGKMEIKVDEGKGQRVGSHITLRGKVFGVDLYLDEVVIEHQPPHVKSWETVGQPKLLVVGRYRLRVEIQPAEHGAKLSVSIDYDLPQTHRWLGILFGKMYAKWCVAQMTDGVRKAFRNSLKREGR